MIIISPSKTMQFSDVENHNIDPTLNNEPILKVMSKMSKQKMKELYKVSDTILETVYQQWRQFDSLPTNIAIKAYTGMSFKGINYATLTAEDKTYLENNVRILSAFYGLLTPHTSIKPYRMDFNLKMKINLYEYWEISLEEPIINLASKEYSKMIAQPMITITFMENIDGKLKNKATYAKQARGYFVRYLIQNKSQSIETIKAFDLLGYQYNREASTDTEFVFSR